MAYLRSQQTPWSGETLNEQKTKCYCSALFRTELTSTTEGKITRSPEVTTFINRVGPLYREAGPPIIPTVTKTAESP